MRAIAIALVIAALLVLSVGGAWAQYRDCREAGFGRAMCIGLATK